MGKYIVTIDKLYAGVCQLFKSLDQFPIIEKKVLDSGLVLGMEYADPEGRIVVDASGDKVMVYAGVCPPEVNPKVKLTLSADTAHLYWLGKVNFMLALQKGDIKSSGDLGAVLKLVPVLGPLFRVYADGLRNNGMADLIV